MHITTLKKLDNFFNGFFFKIFNPTKGPENKKI